LRLSSSGSGKAPVRAYSSAASVNFANGSIPWPDLVSGDQNRHGARFTVVFADEVGLADATAQWQHLERAGDRRLDRTLSPAVRILIHDALFDEVAGEAIP
jgi:hypothetical protein